MSNVVLIIIMALSQVLGLGGDVDSRLEKALKGELGDRVQAVEVEAHINKGSLLVKGKIAAIDFRLEGLYVKPVRIEEAYFIVKDIRIRAEKVLLGKAEDSIRSIGDISLRFSFLPNDLSHALDLQSELIDEPEVIIEKGQVVIRGRYALGPLSLPFEVQGYFSYEGGSKIYYRISRVRMAGLGFPAGLKKKLESELNPIFDLGEFHAKRRDEFKRCEEMLGRELKVVITHIVVEKDRIIVTGSI
jgi:hypothetical protein